MEDGEILNLNWNRMSMLSGLQNKKKLEQEELDMRVAFQNSFATAKTDEERVKIVKLVEKTLDNSMIKSINSYLKNNI